MDLAGLLMILAGAYLIDSALKNRAPLTTLKSIVKDPKTAKTQLSLAKVSSAPPQADGTGAGGGTGFAPTTGVAGGGSGSTGDGTSGGSW